MFSMSYECKSIHLSTLPKILRWTLWPARCAIRKTHRFNINRIYMSFRLLQTERRFRSETKSASYLVHAWPEDEATSSASHFRDLGGSEVYIHISSRRSRASRTWMTSVNMMCNLMGVHSEEWCISRRGVDWMRRYIHFENMVEKYIH